MFSPVFRVNSNAGQLVLFNLSVFRRFCLSTRIMPFNKSEVSASPVPHDQEVKNKYIDLLDQVLISEAIPRCQDRKEDIALSIENIM